DMIHSGTKILHTKRLTLRPFTVGDAEEMFENWANDPEVTRYLSWQPHGNVELTRALLTQWEEDSKDPANYNWAIVLHEGEKDILIGNISLLHVNEFHERAEVGYCMAKRYWGKGIMTEAFLEVLRYCFEEVGFYRITGHHAAPNIGSGKVMEKCGLLYEGTMRKHSRLLSTDERVDIVKRAILREDYLNNLRK
ncbi:MAG: GNAT family N-acetyltransferase, partial [Clostridia bacterium]|nr:GNAT family N-acetyltransferase [Clostridia bacterium]